MTINNSIGMVITESWLSSKILDTEIHILSFELFRGDRNYCYRQDSPAYLRQNSHCMKERSFSNSTVDILTFKCRKLDSIFRIIYRPPEMHDNEWDEAINIINDTIDTIEN